MELMDINNYEQYGIEETFIVMRLHDSFVIATRINHPTHMRDYEIMIQTLIKDKNVCYIYIKLREIPRVCTPIWFPLYNKSIFVSKNPLYVFLMSEMGNDFKNCEREIDKIALYKCCSNYIKKQTNIPTLKDFMSDYFGDIFIYRNKEHWTLEIRPPRSSQEEYRISIQDHAIFCESHKDSVINLIRNWIKNDKIDFMLGTKKTEDILILLKYFIGYDLDEDKGKEEYFTKRQLAHLNNVIDKFYENLPALTVYARFVDWERLNLLKITLAKTKIGSLDNE